MASERAIANTADLGVRVRHFAFSLVLALSGTGICGSARAADHTLNDVTIDFGVIKVVIPKIEIHGTPLDLAGATSLFDAKSTESAVSRFSRLNAATILVPELHLDQDIAGQRQRATYKDTTATDIVAGRIGKMTTASTTAVTTDKIFGSISQKIGLTTVEGLDLTVGARFLTEAARPGETPDFQTLYKSYAFSDYAMAFGAIGTVKLVSATARDARVRQGNTPFMAMMPEIMAFVEKQNAATARGEKAGEPGKDDMKAIGRIFGILENFENGEMEAVGLTGSFKAQGVPLDFRLARMFFSDKADKGAFRLEGFDLSGGPVKAALASYSANGFSFAGTIRAVVEAFQSDNPDAALAANPLKYIPKLGSIKISGLSIEAPDDKVRDTAGKPETVKLGLRAGEIGVGAQTNGIPTAITFSLDGLSMPISAGETRAGLRDIAALGYNGVDLSMAIEGAWSEARNEFTIGNVALAGVDMGSIALSGLLGNIGKDVFSGDQALMQVALLGASAKKLDIEVKDKGLFARVIEREAKVRKKSAEDLRKEFGTIAAVGLTAILGPSDGAKTIVAALSRFVARPGALTLSASARSASGLGLADVIAISEPAAIFDKLDVKASAE